MCSIKTTITVELMLRIPVAAEKQKTRSTKQTTKLSVNQGKIEQRY